MEHYVILGTWTDQGVRNVRESPKRAESARHMAEQMGGKLSVWYTLGRYDIVAMAEFANDETYLEFALQLESQGNMRTQTLKAWSEADATQVIAKVRQM